MLWVEPTKMINIAHLEFPPGQTHLQQPFEKRTSASSDLKLPNQYINIAYS